MTGILDGKRIVVTGASRGLGRAIAEACAREGARVAIGCHARRDDADAVAAGIESRFGGRPPVAAFDHADAAAVAVAVSQLNEALGGIDAWVNNAAQNLPGLFVTSDADRLARQIAVALVGPMHCARAAIEVMMRQRRGVLLNVSSVAAVRPTRGQAAYAAAKAGLEGLTRALAVEYAKKGIRVLCLRPGPVDTDMLAPTKVLTENGITDRTPLGRSASAAEIAEHAVFMLSDKAAYATGSVVTVDGGYVIA